MIVATVELENGYCLQGFDNDVIIEGSIYTPDNQVVPETYGFWHKHTAQGQANLWLFYNLNK